jgi:hypothetical protein
MRVEFSHARGYTRSQARPQDRLQARSQTRLVPMLLALCVIVCGPPILVGEPAGGFAPVQADDAPAPHLTLVFFSQHRLPERAWAALFAAMRAELPEADAEIPALSANVELVRGDQLARGVLVPESVTVYLHGDCNPAPLPVPFAGGVRLGWVVKDGAQIVPVIHVECTAVGQEISERTEWQTRDARTGAMSEALARVILHEWAHIATQSSAHGAKGITKAQFGVGDLIQNRREALICTRGQR